MDRRIRCQDQRPADQSPLGVVAERMLGRVCVCVEGGGGSFLQSICLLAFCRGRVFVFVYVTVVVKYTTDRQRGL